jgi:hypothetical protein
VCGVSLQLSGVVVSGESKRRQIAVLVRRRRAVLYARAIVPGRVESLKSGKSCRYVRVEVAA